MPMLPTLTPDRAGNHMRRCRSGRRLECYSPPHQHDCRCGHGGRVGGQREQCHGRWANNEGSATASVRGYSGGRVQRKQRHGGWTHPWSMVWPIVRRTWWVVFWDWVALRRPRQRGQATTAALTGRTVMSKASQLHLLLKLVLINRQLFLVYVYRSQICRCRRCGQ